MFLSFQITCRDLIFPPSCIFFFIVDYITRVDIMFYSWPSRIERKIECNWRILCCGSIICFGTKAPWVDIMSLLMSSFLPHVINEILRTYKLFRNKSFVNVYQITYNILFVFSSCDEQIRCFEPTVWTTSEKKEKKMPRQLTLGHLLYPFFLCLTKWFREVFNLISNGH